MSRNLTSIPPLPKRTEEWLISKWKKELGIENMDKSYKKLIKKEKSLEKDTKKVLAKDKARDKMVDKAKAMKKGKC